MNREELMEEPIIIDGVECNYEDIFPEIINIRGEVKTSYEDLKNY